MADLDHWIDIAKQCKYLPENDLKVTHADLSTFSFPVAFYELHSSHSLGHKLTEIVRLRLRIAARGIKRPASFHTGYSLWRYPWTGT